MRLFYVDYYIGKRMVRDAPFFISFEAVMELRPFAVRENGIVLVYNYKVVKKKNPA